MLENTIIILNGPPDSGKDVIAKYICNKTSATHSEFKEELYKFTADLFNVDKYWLKDVATNRDTKDLINGNLCLFEAEFNELQNYLNRYKMICNEYQCISPREALIYASELVAKPMYGNDYFGYQAAEKLTLNVGNVFSDGGFEEELHPLAEKAGQLNVFIVRLYRDSCDFNNDSRKYLYVDNFYSCDINNSGTIEEAGNKILDWVKIIRDTQQLTFGDAINDN